MPEAPPPPRSDPPATHPPASGRRIAEPPAPGLRAADPPAAPAGAPGPAEPPPAASLGQVVGAVFWSFFGVRKGKAMRSDEVRIRPHQVIIVGVLLAAAFVATLLLIVRAILKTAGA